MKNITWVCEIQQSAVELLPKEPNEYALIELQHGDTLNRILNKHTKEVKAFLTVQYLVKS